MARVRIRAGGLRDPHPLVQMVREQAGALIRMVAGLAETVEDREDRPESFESKGLGRR